jgi:transcriptional regulator with XRE-family HTH domain
MNVWESSAAPRSIGERIRRTRKARGLSQADLAALIGVSQPAIANWETGVHDPRRIALAKLADALQTPLDWLAAGDRSLFEADKHAVAAYIRRPVQHVPVISLRAALLLVRDPTADPHTMAEDYLPVTTAMEKLFAVFVNDEAMDLIFPIGSLVVVDYGDKQPKGGRFYLAAVSDAPLLRRWRDAPPRLEPHSSNASYAPIKMDSTTSVIGCVKLSIRIH